MVAFDLLASVPCSARHGSLQHRQADQRQREPEQPDVGAAAGGVHVRHARRDAALVREQSNEHARYRAGGAAPRSGPIPGRGSATRGSMANVTDASFINTYAQELKNFQAVIDAGKAIDQPLLWGPAQVMRSLIFGYVTDIWGDVPFREALQGDAATVNIVPAYDPQKEIYDGLFADLSEAVTAIAGRRRDCVLAALTRSTPATLCAGSGSPTRSALRHAMRLANVDATNSTGADYGGNGGARRAHRLQRRQRAHGLAGRRSVRQSVVGQQPGRATITGCRIV